jgi:hypothetical protein
VEEIPSSHRISSKDRHHPKTRTRICRFMEIAATRWLTMMCRSREYESYLLPGSPKADDHYHHVTSTYRPRNTTSPPHRNPQLSRTREYPKVVRKTSNQLLIHPCLHTLGLQVIRPLCGTVDCTCCTSKKPPWGSHPRPELASTFQSIYKIRDGPAGLQEI